jgi:serine/threonine protein kinase/tetratricopeptide (TPR) repeat protein
MPENSKLPDKGETIGGRFQILEKLGSGGFGTVYKALQENIGREVALKFLTPGVAKNPSNVERFRREAFHVSKLRHPNTITLYDYGQTDENLIYMVMELIDGVSLVDEIERVDGLGLERGPDIYEQILQSLSEAHREGLVHRDLKPENIFLCKMFGKEDYVKVLDFGVAKMTLKSSQKTPDDETDESLTQAGDIFGTPMYMAPEQASDASITPATDVYALGLLLYEMLTARPPVMGSNRVEVINKQLNEPVPRLTPELQTSPLGTLIETACSKEPDDRFEDASELLDEFERAMKRIEVSSSEDSETDEKLEETIVSETMPDTIIDESPSFDADPTVVEPPPIPSEEIASKETDADSRLIGREELVENILSEIQPEKEGSGGAFVLLEGENGVGKSKVVEHLAERLSDSGLRTGRGYFRRNSLPMEGLREAIIDAWGLDGASRETIQNQIQTQLDGDKDFSSDELEFLADFLARTGIGGLQISDSSDQAGALFALFERLFRHFASTDSIAIFLEDIDRADGTTLRFLEYLAVTLNTQSLPLTLVMTHKPSADPGSTKVQQHLRSINTSTGGALTRYSVKPLEGEALDELLDSILPMEEVLRERIGWLSQGIPLHAIQIIQYLRNEGNLEKQSDRWHLKEGNPREIELPPDLLDLMGLRAQQIIQGYKGEVDIQPILEWFAVLGMTAPVELLKNILQDETELSESDIERGLQILSDEGIVKQITEHDILTVEFQNNLLREALLENLDRQWSNRHFHQTAALAKIDFYDKQSQDVPIVEIADHWRQAGETQKYRDTLYEAAKQALDHFDLDRARARYLELSDALDDQQLRNLRWKKTQLALADIAQRLGKFGQAEQYYRRATEKSDEGAISQEQASGLRGFAELLSVQNRHREALDKYREALQTSQAINDSEGRAKAFIGISETQLRSGNLDEQKKAQQKLESLLEELENPAVVGEIMLHLAQVAKRRGNLGRRLDLLERARTQLEGTGNRENLSDCLVALGAALIDPSLDRPDQMEQAEDVLKDALELKRSIGDRLGVAEGYRYLGQLEYSRENYDSAISLLEQTLTLHQALNVPDRISATLNDLGIVHSMRVDLDAADEYFARAIEQLQEVEDPLFESTAIMNRGLVALNRRDVDRAARYFQKARSMKSAEETGWALPDLQNNLAFVRLWEGEFDKGKELFRKTLEHADEEGSAEELAVARSYLGLLYCFTGQLQAAALEIGRAKADAEDLQSDRLQNLCFANAAFYAKLNETEKTTRQLLGKLDNKKPFNDLLPDVWLGLLENMRQEVSSRESDPQFVERLEQTVNHFFDAFDQ